MCRYRLRLRNIAPAPNAGRLSVAGLRPKGPVDVGGDLGFSDYLSTGVDRECRCPRRAAKVARAAAARPAQCRPNPARLPFRKCYPNPGGFEPRPNVWYGNWRRAISNRLNGIRDKVLRPGEQV